MKLLSTLALSLLALGIAMPAAAGDVKVVKKVAPEYPADALRSGTTGYVDLEVSVAAGGKVDNVSIVNAKPARTFERNAVAAVKKWEYSAPEGGKAKLRVDFKQD